MCSLRYVFHTDIFIPTLSVQDTGIPEVIAEAQKFQWEYIDAK